MSEEAREVRRALFESPMFRDEVADRLDLDIAKVVPPIDALLEAKAIPCSRADNAQALATDGTKMLLAIGSQQVRPASVVRVAERLGAMTMQAEVGNKTSTGAADIFPRSAVSFEADLAEMFQNLWRAAYGSSPDGFRATAVSVLWNDERGSLLFGKLEQWEKGRRRRTRIYASETLRLPAAPGGDWDFVQLPTVGGTVFAPLPLLGFYELLDEGVEDSAASLR
jgi:hypothetical protein